MVVVSVTFLGTLYSTMKKPGFSTARERPFKVGPGTKVASVMVARSLISPALKATEPTPVLLPPSYLPLTEAFILPFDTHKALGRCLVRVRESGEKRSR